MLELHHMNEYRSALYRTSVAVVWVIAVLNTIAIEQFLYWRIAPFDMVMHFLGGAALGFLIFSFCLRKTSWHHKTTTCIIVSVLTALLVGVGWEIFEWVFGLQKVFSHVHIFDTLSDLALDAGGALGAVIFSERFIKKMYVSR